KKEAPGSYSGGRSFSGGVAAVGRRASRGDPGLYRRAVPGDTTRSELDPLGELPDLLEPRYVLVRVGYAINRLQALLVDEPKVRHRNLRVREHRDAARVAQATHLESSATVVLV